MRPIAFGILRSLNAANLYYMILLPTILILRNPQVHVGFPYSSNNTSNVKTSVNDLFCICAILDIPDIDPYNSYIRLGRYFNNVWFRCKDYVVENVVILEDAFNIIRGYMRVQVVNIIWNAYNFEIGLQLQKPWWRDTICIKWKRILNVFFYFLEISVRQDIVSSDDDSFIISTDEVSNGVKLDVFESIV